MLSQFSIEGATAVCTISAQENWGRATGNQADSRSKEWQLPCGMWFYVMALRTTPLQIRGFSPVGVLEEWNAGVMGDLKTQGGRVHSCLCR